MRANDDDIKIFHPKKTDAAGADLAELALLVDYYRSNGNIYNTEFEFSLFLQEILPF